MYVKMEKPAPLSSRGSGVDAGSSIAAWDAVAARTSEHRGEAMRTKVKNTT